MEIETSHCPTTRGTFLDAVSDVMEELLRDSIIGCSDSMIFGLSASVLHNLIADPRFWHDVSRWHDKSKDEDHRRSCYRHVLQNSNMGQLHTRPWIASVANFVKFTRLHMDPKLPPRYVFIILSAAASDV